MVTGFGILGIVFHLNSLDLTFGIVGKDDLHRIDNGHTSGGNGVEILADSVLKQSYTVECLILGVADLINEVADGAWSETAAAHT